MTNPLQGSDEETQERIAQVRARLSAATPGPWDLLEDSQSEVTVRAKGKVISGVVATVRIAWVHATQRFEQYANSVFIANAPTDVAFLLSRVDSLESALREAQNQIAHFRAGMVNYGQHTQRCTAMRSAGPCDCGFHGTLDRFATKGRT